MGNKRIHNNRARKGPDPTSIFPLRADVRTEERDGRIVLIYPKDFSRFERKLHSIIGGPTDIKRPLDDVGTMLWRMSDGTNNIISIYTAEQEAFKERVEPVDKVVGGLLETLLKLGLMSLEYRDDGEAGPKERMAERLLVRSPE